MWVRISPKAYLTIRMAKNQLKLGGCRKILVTIDLDLARELKKLLNMWVRVILITVSNGIQLFEKRAVYERSTKRFMLILRRCLWYNGYSRRKWTRRHEFKSWTRLTAFHIVLILLGKVWIQLFTLQLWVNSRADWFLQTSWGNLSRRRKTLNSNLLKSDKKLTMCHILFERRET